MRAQVLSASLQQRQTDQRTPAEVRTDDAKEAVAQAERYATTICACVGATRGHTPDAIWDLLANAVERRAAAVDDLAAARAAEGGAQ